MKKCQENVWVLEHLNSEQELSIKIEKDVTNINMWIQKHPLSYYPIARKPNMDKIEYTNANLYFSEKNL